MQIRLPVVSGRQTVRALEKAGFVQVPGGKGSHIKLKRDGNMIVVPDHRPLKRGTLRSIIRQAGLTVEQFVNLL